MTMTDLLLAGLATIPAAAVTWSFGAIVDRCNPPAQQRLIFWSLSVWIALYAFVVFLMGMNGILPDGIRPPSLPSSALALSAASLPAATMGALLFSARHQEALPQILAALWLVGILFRVVQLSRKYLMLRRLKEEANTASISDADEIHVASTVSVRFSESATSPVVLGIFKPLIALPLAYRRMEAETTGLICRHELQHIRQNDNISLLLEELLLSVFWFNPILPALRARLAAAREEVCDEIALRGATIKQRELYAKALFQTLRTTAGSIPVSTFIGLGRQHQARRFAAIISPASLVSRRITLSVSFGAAVGCCIMAGSVAASISRVAEAPFAQFTERPHAFIKLDCTSQSGQIRAWREGATQVNRTFNLPLAPGSQVLLNVATWKVTIRPGVLPEGQIGVVAMLDDDHRPAQLTYICDDRHIQTDTFEIGGQMTTEKGETHPHPQTFMLTHHGSNDLAFETMTMRP